MKKKKSVIKLRPLSGNEQRAANAFLRSVVFTYDSRWLLEKEGDAAKACVPHFKRPWTSGYLPPAERDAYLGMFTKEVVFKLQARWYIEVYAWFRDERGNVYREDGQVFSDFGKINDSMQLVISERDKLKAAGNHKHFLFYEWKAEVYKDQPKWKALDDEQGAA